MDIVEQVSVGFAQHTDRPMSAIDAALYYVVSRLQQQQLSGHLEEEVITSSLMGSMSSTFPLSIALFGTGEPQNTECYWAQYRKAKPTGVSQKDFEAVSGADFALVLRLGDDLCRVALFQGKKGEVSRLPGGKINLHRRCDPPKGNIDDPTWRPAQMVALRDAGVAIMDAIDPGVVHTIEHLCWIHYLGYFDKLARAIQMADLGGHLAREETNKTFRINAVELRATDPVFLHVLLAGLGSDKDAARYWLPMTWKQACDHLPALRNLTELYLADESRGSGSIDMQAQPDSVITQVALSRPNGYDPVDAPGAPGRKMGN
jgi:hypothetical protein